MVIVALLAVIFWSCGSGNKSKQIKDYKYTKEKAAVIDSIPMKAGSWVSEGTTCYGIIISLNRQGKSTKVKEIEARIVSIQPGIIKLKALENITMTPVQGCDAISLKIGDIWDEKEGEVFRTREEAVKYINMNYSGLRYVSD